MTVQELIDALQDFPPDSLVMIPSVGEVFEEMEAGEVTVNDYDNGPLIA